MSIAPFWPRVSPHFLACRRSIRHFEQPAVIGLSGGPDSLALVAAAAAEGFDARAVVVDHGLQDGSGAVADRARAAAESFGVLATVVRVSVNAAPGSSLEAAAREARYEALAAEAARDGRDIWVAHTLDDQAETLLLGALRGNPAGMPVVGTYGPATVVRPFLGIRRADTVSACGELGLEPWHDPMNDDSAYRRVSIRQQVIPQLSELIGGDAVPALGRTAERIAADQGLIEDSFDLNPTNDCPALAADPAPIRQRRILAWLRDHGLAATRAQLADIERLCSDWHGQGAVSVGGARVVRRGGKLSLDGRPAGRDR